MEADQCALGSKGKAFKSVRAIKEYFIKEYYSHLSLKDEWKLN